MHGVTKKCIRTAVVLCRSSSYHMMGSIYRRIYLRHFDVRNVSVSWNLAVIILVDVICISQIIQNSYILLSGTGLTPFPIAISNPPLPAGLAVQCPSSGTLACGLWVQKCPMTANGIGAKPRLCLESQVKDRYLGFSLRGLGSQFIIKNEIFFSLPWNKNGLKKQTNTNPQETHI